MVQPNMDYANGNYVRKDINALKSDEIGSLISADKVAGTSVYDLNGDKIGSVDKVMVDKRSGHVAYAVMSFGGFLGMGSKYHPLPWAMLNYDEDKGGYVVNIDKRVLEGAPTIDNDNDIDWNDRVWGAQVHDYYHTPPYWL